MRKTVERSLNQHRRGQSRGNGTMVLKESGEMYLETIYVLSQRNVAVRSADVGAELNFSRPSVSRAIHILEEGGFLTIEKGGLRLTEVGREYAEKIYERHTVLTQCFVALGVDREIAANDACRIEHIISDECFGALKTHLSDLWAAAAAAK